MPQLNRLQIIQIVLAGICLMTLTVYIVFIIMDTPTILPFVVLGELFILAMTFFLEKLQKYQTTSQVQARPVYVTPHRVRVQPVRAPVAQQVVRVRNVAPPLQQPVINNKKFGEGFWNWVNTWFKPRATNAINTASQGANHGSAVVTSHVKQSPLLWLGILLCVTAIGQLILADDNWRMSHAAMFTAFSGVVSILGHYNQLKKTGDALMKHWRIVWLVLSLAAIFLWMEHDWSNTTLVASILSAICALITLGSWWGNVASGTGEVTGVAYQKFLDFFKGEHGFWKAALLLCLSTLAIYYFFFYGGELLLDDEEAWARLTSLVYVILLFAFCVGLIVAVNKKLK
jgi:hypothetical protein